MGGSAVLQGGIAAAVCAQLGEQVRMRVLGGTRWLVATGLVSTWRLAETASECADCPASVCLSGLTVARGGHLDRAGRFCRALKGQEIAD